MSNDDRNRLRDVQDRFLARPGVAAFIRDAGEDMSIWPHLGGPTIRQIRERELPNWAGCFEREGL